MDIHNFFLLVCSLFFYVWGQGLYTTILVLSVVLNYVFGRIIERNISSSNRRSKLAFGIVFSLGLLIIFKYLNFITDNLNLVLAYLNIKPLAVGTIQMPLGISFFTFQGLTYLVDIYRGEAPAQKNSLRLALFLSLFTNISAGPILKYKEIVGQLVSRTTTLRDISWGVKRFTVGLAKKDLVANTLAVPVDKIFAIPSEQLTFGLAWLGAICYTIQIYFDFSGYSDMAIGLGRIFGFRFPENFNYPYISKSIREFWRRWHISLSTWFRDYLYIPLGGNRCSPIRVYGNLIAVFFLCGLWHGASWNFIFWGLFHGLLLVLERSFLSKKLALLWLPLSNAYTIFFVCIAWVFFRADTLSAAGAFLAAMFGLGLGDGVVQNIGLYLDNQVLLALLAGGLGSLPIFPRIGNWIERTSAGQGTLEKSLFVEVLVVARAFLLVGLLIISLASVAAGTHSPFIYFRF